MGVFSKYTYSMPERLTKDEARQRRVLSELSRQRKALEDRPARLSPANKFHYNRLKEFEDKFGAEIEARRARVEQVRRDPSLSRSRTHLAAISRLFQLQQTRRSLLQRAASEKRANAFASAPAFDSRLFSFTDKFSSPRTVFGSNAWVKVVVAPSSRRLFRHPLMSLPCIQRAVRREVIFARGHGHKAHRGRRRFSALSLIGC